MNRHRPIKNYWLMIATGLVLLAGCSQMPDSLHYQPSTTTPSYTQSSFSQYQLETRQWLMDERAFITSNKQREVDFNAPFELLPEQAGKTRKGILLVHGLGDSPYSFVDIAPVLAKQGFRVRTILLPGHGARPGDLLNVNAADWAKAVAHHTRLLKKDVDEVWLGGFSTGANLVTNQALDDPSIKGLVLYAPAFKPESQLIALSSLVAHFADWADKDPVDNLARFDSITFQAADAYYQTTKAVYHKLREQSFDRPVFMAISEHDSVLNSHDLLETFEQRFTHPDSRLVWLGNPVVTDDKRVTVLSGSLPEWRISNFSHMAALFSPDNPYYGVNGEYRMCNNGQGKAESNCPTDKRIWYSAYGYQEDGKLHARLTFNPYFEQLADAIADVSS